jgi:hypothetical protein
MIVSLTYYLIIIYEAEVKKYWDIILNEDI